ncbi:MAG: hypothetical protein JWO38_2588, partial [Gemmataceae bacterium]|nr:hypothetical protein [Gemmataceae bacterium]
FGRLTAPPKEPDFSGCRVINVVPATSLAGPEVADPNGYEAHISYPDHHVIALPVSPGLAQVHARSRGAVEKPTP